MKYAEFMTAITGIYGPYSSPILEQITFKYIKERFSEADLQAVIEKLILKKTTKYKDTKPPDPAEFEELFPIQKKSIEAEALKWWDELNRKTNSYRDCVISDVRAYKALQTMGGWVWFCQRLKTDENGKDLDQWTRKQFVDLFKLYSENPPEGQIGILPGLGEMKKQPVMIGNQDQCLLISQGKNKPMELVEDMTKNLRRML